MGKNFHRFVILAIAGLLFVAVAFRFARMSPRTTRAAKTVEAERPAVGVSRPSATKAPPPAAHGPLPRISSTPLASVAGAATPSSTAPAPNDPSMLELDQVNLMIRDYRTLTGGNPVGTNAEIMAALMGQNPKQAKLGPPEGAKLNEKGELIDRWGTPYFFHQLARDHMEIRSAGPDRVLWTVDDPVVR
jgi:hypothetical protein